MLICAVASLILVLTGALVMDWYRLTLETADGLTRAVIDLRNVRACSPGHPCTTQSLTPMAGMFPTLAAVTLWSSIGFAGLVMLQTGARVFTGGAYEVFTKIGYMLALMAISLTVATAYMFGPESHGVAAALASRPGIDLHRTWGPLTLVVGLSLGFVAIYLAVSRESSDLGATYKPVTIPPGSKDLRERPSSNRVQASARPRTAPQRADASAASAGAARAARGASAAESPTSAPKSSSSGAMTAIERRDPAGVLRLARQSAIARRRELLGDGHNRSAAERRDASVAARMPSGPGPAEHREPAGRPLTVRDASSAEVSGGGRRNEHSAAARLELGAAYGTSIELADPRARAGAIPSSLRPTRDLQVPDVRAASHPRAGEPAVAERLESSGLYRPRDVSAASPGDASGLGLVANRATRDLRSPERREPLGAGRRDEPAAERHAPGGTDRRDESTGAERHEPSGAHRRGEPGPAELSDVSGHGRSEVTGAGPPDASVELRPRTGTSPGVHRVTREFRSVERREPSGSWLRGEPDAAEPRERTGTGVPRRTRDGSVAERLEQSGSYRPGDSSAAERLEPSGTDRRSEPELRERTGTGVPRGTRELTPAERLEQSGTYRRGEPGSLESSVRTAREINSAEHRDYTGVRPGELASTEVRESTGVHREPTGTLRSAERGGEVREATGPQRGSELRGGVQIGVLRVRTQPSAARAASDGIPPEPPEHTGMTRVADDDPGEASREQTGVGRTLRGTTSAVPREPAPGRPIGSTPIGVLRTAPDASGAVREQTGVLRAARGTTSAPEREHSSVLRAPSGAEPAGSPRARTALPSPPEHLRNQLSYVALTAELTGGGIDARREDGLVRLVLWRDIVGVVARRMPPDAGGAAFVDIVSTAGSTLRIVPWTRLSGEPIDADGDDRPRAVVEHIVARCPSVRLDPATQQFLDTGEPAQLPDLETLRAHDSRLA